jgi:DNA polymerase III sliding clamp (beta) subunit (PCNA family)
MDLTVDQAALSRALRLVARVAPVRPTLPILQMVLLAGEPGRLRLTATDAELAMTTVSPADVATSGGWPSPPASSASTWRSYPPSRCA